jgi:glucokinase
MGMAKGIQDAIYLSVGTGIGAGILSGGSVIRGQDGIAGAIGWMALSSKFRKDFSSCGNCEFQASGSGMVRLANQLVPAGSKHFKDAQALFSAFEQGHPIAKKVIREAVRTWGKSVANLVSVFNPSMIIFGGGIFGPAAQLLPEIKKEAFRWAQPISMSRVLIGISPLKGDAGLFGAGRLSFKEI